MKETWYCLFFMRDVCRDCRRQMIPLHRRRKQRTVKVTNVCLSVTSQGHRLQLVPEAFFCLFFFMIFLMSGDSLSKDDAVFDMNSCFFS